MAKLATTHSLSDYVKLNIAAYRKQLRQGDADSLAVRYSYRDKHYSYSIQLTTTAPHYGGLRYWFLCNQCSKKVSSLYCAGLYVCRHCIGASYKSQMQTDIDRTHSKLDALRERLGWQVGIINGHGIKPHLMHHSKYERLISEYDRLIQKLIGGYQNAITKPK